jgi:hypothetical protein
MDKTISPKTANILALVLVPFVAVIFFVPYSLVWGSASLQLAFDRLVSPFLLVVALSVVAHEVLHGVGYTLVGGVPWREIKFGIKGLMVYAHCRAPLSASAYRVATVLPGMILGVIPGLVGLVWGNAWLTVYGTLMSVAALGDFLILWLVWFVPADARVKDHPSAPGCRVLLD